MAGTFAELLRDLRRARAAQSKPGLADAILRLTSSDPADNDGLEAVAERLCHTSPATLELTVAELELHALLRGVHERGAAQAYADLTETLAQLAGQMDRHPHGDRARDILRRTAESWSEAARALQQGLDVTKPVSTNPRTPLRHRALERQLVDAHTRDEALLVYADWLVEHGHPLGELISLHHARDTVRLAEHVARITEAIADLEAGAASQLLGPVRGRETGILGQRVQGFYRSLRLQMNQFPVEPVADSGQATHALLAHPACAMLEALTVKGYPEPSGLGQQIVDAIAATGPHLALTQLDLRLESLEAEHDVSHLWAAVPALRRIDLQVRKPRLPASVTLPALEQARFGVLDAAGVAAICSGSWPNLTTLEIRVGYRHIPLSLLEPLLAGRTAPGLRRLSLREFRNADALMDLVPKTAIARQIEKLDVTSVYLSR